MSDSNSDSKARALSSIIPKGMIKWIVIGVVALLLIIMGIALYSTSQSVISEGNKREATLSAQYANGANVLSNCVVQTKQSAGLAVAQSAQLDKILTDAVGGRYDNGGTAVDSGKLFSAIQEAYPDLSGLDKTFQLVLATINGCRDDFKNQQTVVLSSVSDFKAWRTGSWKVRTLGGDKFPDENLSIDILGIKATGPAALKKMSHPIVESTTNKTYQDGTYDAENPFGE